MYAVCCQVIQRFEHRTIRAAIGNDTYAGFFLCPFQNRLGYQCLGSFPFNQQAVNELLVFSGALGIKPVLVVPGATHKISALGIFAGQGPGSNTVTIGIEVTIKLFQFIDIIRAQNLATIRLSTVIPLEFWNHPVIHTDIQV